MFRFPAILVLALPLIAAGCNLVGPNRNYDAELAHYKQVAKTVEHSQLDTPPSEYAFSPQPRTIDYNAAPRQAHEWWDMTLDEAIQTAVARSSVLRDLGGTIVRSPETVRTILNPAVVASDARFGMEAALSEFDATLGTSVIAEKNDRMVNNFVSAGGTRFFQQDLINFQSQISKLGATGTRMTLRGLSTYDFNNASFNRFPSVWDTLVEAEIRQPLWQGAGARFNRLAGPSAVPGFYNGVLIARVNTDISVADFEMGLRDLVSNIENAYWDLYFAYRDLDAKIQLRNASLEAWKRNKVLVESDQASGQIEREVQAREQYFRYEEEVQNALAGTLQQSTTNNNGASGGSFRGIGGVLVSERRLRLAIGLPITDGRMIRPADEPTLAKVSFDWATASDDAVAHRPELLKQRLVVKRREMEYVAARNFLLPRFDMLGRYRVRGLGKDLIGNQSGLPFDPTDPNGYFARSSLANLANGDFQEWQLGGEVTMPIGFRRGWAGVRNAQLNLAREKAVLEEQERQVMHDLSNAVGDMDRTYKNMEATYNRRLAAQQNVEILRFRLQNSQPVSAEQLLEAERRHAESEIQYHRSLVEHMLAIKNVHFEKGTLLEYGHIQLAEQYSTGGPPPAAPRQIRTTDSGEPTPAAPAPAPQAQPIPEPLPPMPSAPPPILPPPPAYQPPPVISLPQLPPPPPPPQPEPVRFIEPPTYQPPIFERPPFSQAPQRPTGRIVSQQVLLDRSAPAPQPRNQTTASLSALAQEPQLGSMQVIAIPATAPAAPPSSSRVEKTWFSGLTDAGATSTALEMPTHAPASTKNAAWFMPVPAQPALQPLPPVSQLLPTPDPSFRVPQPDGTLRLPSTP
jgi:outer membrane protein TolC